ncbi:hypothetical protein [Humibacillus xanthopallidus]|uniref:Uncharacterized protein n=1 Tax=Humibacillus xanthopallidus TaxID=412689 RepID=A0A543I0Z9_9MICO|nr:hypothetical protein [Humibacillus xanthopallidus]TQM64252.1 hypothetical protein FBY41_0618 [Humibacillus xanthopallidus]
MLVGCHDLLGSLIRSALSTQPDLVVVADLSDPADPATAAATVGAVQPDVVVWNTGDDGFLGSEPALFTQARTTTVVATLDNGRRAALWELRPVPRPIGELTPDSLLAAIRDAARSRTDGARAHHT